MRTRNALLVLLTAMTSAHAAAPVDRQKLRQIARLPRIEVAFGIGMTGKRGFMMSWEEPDIRAEIAAVEKTLKGNPSDAERLYRLGELCTEAKDEASARAAYVRSVELYRQLLRMRPQEGRLLAEFGTALSKTGSDEEADTVLRRAVNLAPQEWRAWTAQGEFLTSQAFSALLPAEPPLHARAGVRNAILDRAALERALQRWSTTLPDYKPTPEQSKRARRLLDEARDCFDRAVAAAPHDPHPYLSRAGFRAFAPVPEQGKVETLREMLTRIASAGTGFAPGPLSDLQQAARLSPDDYRAVAWTAVLELMSFVTSGGRAPGRAQMWSALPPESKQTVRDAVARLEKLARSPETATAAGASELLGFVQFLVMGEDTQAEASLRRAVTLAPAHDHAWEMLTAILGDGDRYADIIPVCKARLAHKDTARTHILLAKAYAKLGQLENAEAQARAALKLQPDDYTANLALAVLLLKQSNDAGVLAQAGERLTRAGKLLEESAPVEKRAEYEATRGIYLGLIGSVKEARQALRQALAHHKDNKEAKAALAALGVQPGGEDSG